MRLIESIGKAQIVDWHSNNKIKKSNEDKGSYESYYSKFDNDNNIFEYSFDSVDDLKTIMRTHMHNYSEKYIHELSVMAFKERFTLDNSKNVSDEVEKDSVYENEKKKEFNIPDFVYVL